MNTLLKHLMLGGSATALVAGASLTAAFAQNATDSSALEIEEVQSSVSRIDLKGFEAPTPVTVVGIDQINRDAKIQIGDQIRELPQVRGGNSINSGSNTNNLSQINAGIDSVNIRGLGANKNLVLFDRQRVVTSAIQDGIVDLALIPSGLTQRVDVVTGGASAAWGSDAVTGVINIVINKTFEGFKGNVTYSDNSDVSNPTYRASLAWGTSFLGGKGHIVAAADFTVSNAGVFQGQVDRAYGNNGRGFIYNSAYCNVANISTMTGTGTCTSPNPGQPYQVYAYGLGSTSAVQGGLVTGNTGGTAGSGLGSAGLKGTMFVGQDSTPTQFNYGTMNGTSTCYNGCTNDQWTGGGYSPVKQPYHSATYFTYASYQILPDVKASIQLNYARLTTRAQGGTASGSRNIYADNPYLPQEIAQRFVCNGTASAACVTTLSNGYNPYTRQNESNAYLPVTTTVGGVTTTTQTLTALNLDARQARPTQNMTVGFEFSGNRNIASASGTGNREATDYNFDDFCGSLLQNCGMYYKQFLRGTFQLEGNIGDSWAWTAYIGHSENRIRERIVNLVQARLSNSLDAVRITSGNQGTSGLPVGSIQCRSLLNPAALGNTVPANAGTYGISVAGEVAGCAPFNPFGEGEITNAARNYIKPGINPDKGGPENYMLAKMAQEAAAFTMSGVLPWALPAGEVGVAYGGEWRLERHGIYEIDDYSLAAMYPSGNFGQTFEGKQHVEEGFLEVQMPILKDTFVQTLNFDMAGRLTNYSNSGLVETWKLGLQSQIIDDVKFRMTWSHDIRAPTIWDIAAPGTLAKQNCAAFVTGPLGSQSPSGIRGTSNDGCFAKAGGNANLNPERANTIAAGFIFTPTFIDGLTMSLDWYQIHLSGGITTPAFGDIITRCRSGELVYCNQLTFTDLSTNIDYTYPAGTMYAVSQVQLRPLNAGLYTTAGFDFNIAYGFDLFTGSMDVSFNGNYNYDYSRTLNGVNFQGAGGGGYYGGGAKFQGNLNFNYREGAWSFGTQFRMVGDQLLNLGNQGNPAIQESRVTYVNGTPTMTSGERNLLLGAETNYQAMRVTTDIRVQYRWSNNITLFANIDNIQNLPFGGFSSRRSYRTGVRFNY